jgi:hypothetical protein
VQALRKKERQDETQFIMKIDHFLSFILSWMLMYFLTGFFKKSHPVYDQSQFWCCVFFTLWISLVTSVLRKEVFEPVYRWVRKVQHYGHLLEDYENISCGILSLTTSLFSPTHLYEYDNINLLCDFS